MCQVHRHASTQKESTVLPVVGLGHQRLHFKHLKHTIIGSCPAYDLQFCTEDLIEHLKSNS